MTTYTEYHTYVADVVETRYGWMPVIRRPSNLACPQRSFARKTRADKAEALRYATVAAHYLQARMMHLRPRLERAV
jgi:hypothetical protein